MSKNLKVLAPCLKDFYKNKGKSFTGAQHFTSNLFEYFDSTSHVLIGVAFGTPPKQKGIKIIHKKRDGKPWIEIQIFVPTLEILHFAQNESDPVINVMIDEIADVFKKIKADVFFMNGLSALTYLLFIAAKRAGIPIVSIHHGIWTLEAKAYSAISSKGINQRRLIEKLLIRNSQKNIFLTRLSYKIFAKTVGRVPKNQLCFITLPYNPIFINHRVPKPSQRKTLNIGMIGRWDPVKNHAAYLALAKEAAKQDLPWRFLAATTINPNLGAMEDLIVDYTRYIEVKSHMTPDELKKFYNSLDIVLVPSHIETFCGVVMETVLQHKPVLVSPFVGWADTLKDYKLKDWIIKFNKPKRVIKRIAKVIKQKPPEQLIRDIEVNNKPEAVFKKYEAIFRGVAN